MAKADWGRLTSLTRLPLRIAASVLTLLAGIFLLGFAGRLALVAGVEAEPVDASVEVVGRHAVVTGHAPRYARLALGTSVHGEVDSTFVDGEGKFRFLVVHRLLVEGTPWLRVMPGTRFHPLELERHRFAAPETSTIEIAQYLTERRMLWLAGTAPARALVPVEVAGAFSPCQPGPVDVGPLGIFDVLVPCEQPPSAVRLQVPGTEQEPPDWRPIEPVSDGELPLARAAVVEYGNGWTSFATEITVPERHPYFRLLTSGLLEGDAFTTAMFGYVFGGRGPEWTTTLSIKDGLGTYRDRWTPKDYPPVALSFFPGNTAGASSRLLLTGKDRITVKFGARRPVSYGGLLPSSLTDGEAEWHGPSPAPESGLRIDFVSAAAGAEPPRPEELRQPQDRAPEPQTLQQRILELGGSQSLALAAWSTLLGLLPFLGLFWITRRSFLGSVAGWPPFLAGAGVMIGWLSWPLAYRALWNPLHELTWKYLSKLAGLTLLRPSRTLTAPELTDATFALALIAITLSLPIVHQAWSAAGGAGDVQGPPSSRGGGRAWRPWLSDGLKVLAGALVLVAMVRAGQIFLAPGPLVAEITAAILQERGPAPWEAAVTTGAEVGFLAAVTLALFALGVALEPADPEVKRRRGLRLTGAVLGLLLALAASILLTTVLLGVPELAGDLREPLVKAARASSEYRVTEGIGQAVMAAAGFTSCLLTVVLLSFVRGWLALAAALVAGWLLVQIPLPEGIGLWPKLAEVYDPSIRPNRWALIAVSALATYPALLAGLRGLLPPGTRPRAISLLALAVTAAAPLVPWIPVKYALGGATTLLTAGTVMLVLRAIDGLVSSPGQPSLLVRWNRTLVIGALVLLGMAVGWPYAADSSSSLSLGDVQSFFYRLRTQTYYLPMGGMAVALLRGPPAATPATSRAMKLVGGFFFAMFLVKPAATWLVVIPLPFLIAILFARYVLFRPEHEQEESRLALEQAGLGAEAAVKKVVVAMELRRRVQSVTRALADQFEKMTLSPEEHDQKVAGYQAYLQSHGAQEDGPADRARAVFAFGLPGQSDNALSALRLGVLLAAVPFLIALYQSLPEMEAANPFTVANLMVFLISLIANWLLTAFFIGYFAPHVRGGTGLVKGLWVFVSLVAPIAFYRLLSVDTLEAMRPLVSWALQTFLFCSALGLLLIDYRLLRRAGFGFRKLGAVHHLPALSAYASSVIAALVPVVTGFLTGGFKDFLTFLSGILLPKK